MLSRIVVAYTVDLWQTDQGWKAQCPMLEYRAWGPAGYAELIREIVHDFLDYIPESGEGGRVDGKIVFNLLDEP